MSFCQTEGVRINVRPYYSPEYSRPDQQKWVFCYEISIENAGVETVQLVNRHWIITDARGGVQEVRGDGVIGEQPLIAPGETFTYESFCPLPTNYGFMRGSYGMIKADGDEFQAEIAPFVLMPHWMLN